MAKWPVVDQNAIDRSCQARGGQGMLQDYKPWLTLRDVPSQEAIHRKKRWKTVRTHPLLSNLEREACFALEWPPKEVEPDARATY